MRLSPNLGGIIGKLGRNGAPSLWTLDRQAINDGYY